jgi:hypothetical protein
MSVGPTAIQSFAVSVLLDALGEDPCNRMAEEYEEIKSLIPKDLKVAHWLVNRRLGTLWRRGTFHKWKVCRFRAGDTVIVDDAYPTSISVETIRQGLVLYGWREESKRRRPS